MHARSLNMASRLWQSCPFNSCILSYVSRQSFALLVWQLSGFPLSWRIVCCVPIQSTGVFGLVPVWSNCGKSCCKHLFMHLSVNIKFHFTGSVISESTSECLVECLGCHVHIPEVITLKGGTSVHCIRAWSLLSQVCSFSEADSHVPWALLGVV